MQGPGKGVYCDELRVANCVVGRPPSILKAATVILQLAEIFINIVVPVFTLVMIGYVASNRLGLESRTLTRFAYFILVPSFVFNLLSVAEVDVRKTVQMVAYIVLVHVAVALLGFGVATLLRRSAEMVGAYVVVAVFGNVGNFGLPIIEFHLGKDAMVVATLYFLSITVVAFIIGVAAATWHRGGGLGAILAVFKTPALLALVPALLVNVSGVDLPLFSRAALRCSPMLWSPPCW